MTDPDRAKFLEVVLGFAELKGKQLSAPALELYWRALKHWTLENFQLAAEQLLRSCEFMPTPKDFEDLRKAARLTAGEAWDRARRAADSCVSNGQVGSGGSCGDALIDRVVRAIGGYAVIFLCDLEKLTFLERRFCEHYGTIEDAQEVRESVPQLMAPETPQRLKGPQPEAA